MDRDLIFEKVKSLFYAIINSLDEINKQKRDYDVVVPEFSIPNQINSKIITKQEYMIYMHIGNTFLEKYSEYHELIEFLEKNYEINREKIEILIIELFNRLLSLCREKICEKKIEKLINIFYKDIIENPLSYKIKGYLTGLSLTDEIYEIDEYLCLRKAISTDFKCRDMGEYTNELQKYSFQFPPVILEYIYQSEKINDNYRDYSRPPELVKELLFLDWAILLFRSAPVFRIKTESKVISLFRRGTTISTGALSIRTVEKYTINNENIENLKAIIMLFRTKKIRKIFEVPQDKPNYINIALNRYQNTYLYSENIPQKITSLISCLEALLSRGAQELKRRLCQRVSIILKIIGFKPLIVNEEVDLAYRIRNKYSHGSAINLKNVIKQDIKDFINNLIEYTRLCFLISMQLNPVKTKKEYLKLIDLSLLDEDSYLKLVKLINENCIVFKD